MKSFKKFFLENTELDEAAITAGDYSLVKTKDKKSTTKHPEGKFVHEIHHNGEKIGTVEPYSSYNEKRKPGSRIVSSRTDATKYSVHFVKDKGPTLSKDISLSSKLGHANPKHALESAARSHQFWKNKNEEVKLDESTIDKNHPIAKEYFDLKKKNLKDLKDMITQRSKISDTSEFRSKEHAASHLIRRIHGDKKVDQVFGFNEEAGLDEGKNLTDTKADWRSDKSATAKNWSHNKLMKVAKHDRSAEKEIKRRIASKEYVFSNEEVELDENIKGWKNAASDISKMRAAQGKTVKLVSLKKDGTESKMHDATKMFRSEDEAQEHHDRVTKLNPKSKIAHNMYVDGKHIKTLGA
jgi:hypothetical protein